MFAVHFRLRKPDSSGEMLFSEQAFYDWPDMQYSDFMIKLLQSLEPRFYMQAEYIFEQDE